MGNDFLDFSETVEDMRDGLEDGLDDANEDGMETVEDRIDAHLRATDTVATKNILRELDTSSGVDDDFVSSVAVHVPEVYKYIEWGTGMYGPYPSPSPKPPIEPMIEWLRAKGVTENLYIRAEGLQDHIGRYGNRAHPFMRPVWYSEGKSTVVSSVAMEMKKQVRQR